MKTSAISYAALALVANQAGQVFAAPTSPSAVSNLAASSDKSDLDFYCEHELTKWKQTTIHEGWEDLTPCWDFDAEGVPGEVPTPSYMLWNLPWNPWLKQAIVDCIAAPEPERTVGQFIYNVTGSFYYVSMPENHDCVRDALVNSGTAPCLRQCMERHGWVLHIPPECRNRPLKTLLRPEHAKTDELSLDTLSQPESHEHLKTEEGAAFSLETLSSPEYIDEEQGTVFLLDKVSLPKEIDTDKRKTISFDMANSPENTTTDGGALQTLQPRDGKYLQGKDDGTTCFQKGSENSWKVDYTVHNLDFYPEWEKHIQHCEWLKNYKYDADERRYSFSIGWWWSCAEFALEMAGGPQCVAHCQSFDRKTRHKRMSISPFEMEVANGTIVY